MATLGQKLRELRHQKGYKLNEVAEGADLSISFISLIERDKASISVENLQKLANFYNVRLFQIFQDIEEEDAYIVRKGQMDQLGEYNNPAIPALFLLSPEDNLSFKSILAYIPPSSYREILQLQKGEAFVLVKEGIIEVGLPNKKPVLLHEGDSAHLTSFKGTTFASAHNDQSAKMLIVASATTQVLDRQGDLLKMQEVIS
jgi:transcriptional regulator with XRE-family HTH domain